MSIERTKLRNAASLSFRETHQQSAARLSNVLFHSINSLLELSRQHPSNSYPHHRTTAKNAHSSAETPAAEAQSTHPSEQHAVDYYATPLHPAHRRGVVSWKDWCDDAIVTGGGLLPSPNFQPLEIVRYRGNVRRILSILYTSNTESLECCHRCFLILCYSKLRSRTMCI